MAEINDTIKKEVEKLQRVRDELRVQAALGKGEAKALWERLEQRWPDVERKIRDIESQSAEAARKIAGATSSLLDEIKEGYRELRKSTGNSDSTKASGP